MDVGRLHHYNSLNLGADSVNEQPGASSRETWKANPMDLLMYYLWKMREKVIRRVALGFLSGWSDHALRQKFIKRPGVRSRVWSYTN